MFRIFGFITLWAQHLRKDGMVAGQMSERSGTLCFKHEGESDNCGNSSYIPLGDIQIS